MATRRHCRHLPCVSHAEKAVSQPPREVPDREAAGVALHRVRPFRPRRALRCNE